MNYVVSLATNTEFSKNIVALATAIPSSVIAQAQTDPTAFANQLETGTAAPAWITAIPTSVANSLESLLAKPNKAGDDLDFIVTAPQASAILANSAIPTSVQDELFTDPLNFIADAFTATTVPAWATKLPNTLQTQVGSIINQELSTVAADFESSSKPTVSYSTRRSPTATVAPTSAKPVFPSGSGNACPICSCPPPVTVISTVTAASSSVKPSGTNSPTVKPPVPTASVAKGTAASSGIKPFTGTKTGAPIAFTGAAAPMRTAAVGAAALFAGAGALLNV